LSAFDSVVTGDGQSSFGGGFANGPVVFELITPGQGARNVDQLDDEWLGVGWWTYGTYLTIDGETNLHWQEIQWIRWTFHLWDTEDPINKNGGQYVRWHLIGDATGRLVVTP
jgi:hypothetical protein